jgi:hypothetical protein
LENLWSKPKWCLTFWTKYLNPHWIKFNLEISSEEELMYFNNLRSFTKKSRNETRKILTQINNKLWPSSKNLVLISCINNNPKLFHKLIKSYRYTNTEFIPGRASFNHSRTKLNTNEILIWKAFWWKFMKSKPKNLLPFFGFDQVLKLFTQYSN